MLVSEKRTNKRKIIEASPAGYIYYYTTNDVVLYAINAPDELVVKSKVALSVNNTVLYDLKANFFTTIRLVGKITNCTHLDSINFLITIHIEYIQLHDLKKLQTQLTRYESVIQPKQSEVRQKQQKLVGGSLVSCSSWNVQVKDLGSKGVRIASTAKIDINSEFQLVFLLPTMEYIVVFGKIVWNKGLHNKIYEYGIQFTKYDKTAKLKIKKYLQAD